MFAPSVFRKNVFDDLFEYPFGGGRNAAQLMKTDVLETDQDYTLLIDLPGIEKDNVSAELKEGYLNITASASQQDDSQDENGRYLRRERFAGTYTRSFYVGDTVTETDIKAKFENGVLKLTIPKKEPQTPPKRTILIEG
ncbi:MAG: Hsp20/alpha crystallin family protein [Oscillospiraceae bacterium]|nr:Hsp20/alpha crystallin family protein [Oscillospiraceae bacterium]